MMYDLPTSLEVCGTEYPIETDFRVILDIFSVLSAVELTSEEKCFGVLGMFYPGFFTMPWEHMEEAIKQCFWFINGGNEEAQKKSTKLMDWEQDFRLLVAPINRIAGQEVRALPYLHWWTFVAAYMEIGDGTLAMVISIREKLANGRKLEKYERQYYHDHPEEFEFSSDKARKERERDEIMEIWNDGS